MMIDFAVDMDGKRYTWQVCQNHTSLYSLSLLGAARNILTSFFSNQGVCKLPFIDEGELLSATQMIEKDLKVSLCLPSCGSFCYL